MINRSLPGFVAGAVFAVAVAGGGAVAATGGKFILGQSNTAGGTSTLTAKHGSALSLRSTGAPALKVNTSRLVPNLNADRLDGLSSTSFARVTAKTGAFDFSGVLVDVDQNGLDDAIVAQASCPAGSQLTGGGSADYTTTGVVIESAPYPNETYVVVALIDEATAEDPTNLIASAICWNPKGGLSGSYRKSTAPTDLSAGVLKSIETKYAAKVAAR
jgi:hypothetical protein